MTSPSAADDPDGWIYVVHEVSPLFLHWELLPDAVRDLVPGQLELDLYDGAAWITVGPHRMERATLRDAPPDSELEFPEVEVRTYVRHRGVPGVWFFSLDAPAESGNELRRQLTHLPYHDAATTIATANGETRAQSIRLDSSGATFEATYRPVGEPHPAAPGSIEHFLLERESMFVRDGQGTLFRGDRGSLPWSLRECEAELVANTLPQASGLPAVGSPALVSCGDELVARFWPLRSLAA